MQIALIFIERIVPGFNELIKAVESTFHARITTATIDLPMTRSFRKERQQYNAAVLLHDLLKFCALPADKMVFIIREDMYVEDLNFVFGLAVKDVCIVSTARLDPRFYGEKDMKKAKRLFNDRVIKEVIHEIGHTMGYGHCRNRKCVMTFSNTMEDVDFKGKEFCKKCKKPSTDYL